MRHRGVRDVKGAQEVERHHPPPLLGRALGHGPQQHHACVVDNDVQPTELGDDRIDRTDRLRFVRHVCRTSQCAPAADPNRGGDLFEQAFAPGDERHACTLLGEPARGRGTDATACPGHERHRALECLHQCPATRPPSTCTVSPVTKVACSR